MQEKTYGKTESGQDIEMPAGWKLLPLGYVVPHVHRFADNFGRWLAEPRRCRSTMTPIFACISGNNRAYAVPAELELEPADATHKRIMPMHNEFWEHFEYNAIWFYKKSGDSVARWAGDRWEPIRSMPDDLIEL